MSKKHKKHKNVVNVKAKPQFSATSMSKTISRIGDNGFPLVYYHRRAWEKMWKYIDLCSQEVGWLGTVEEIEGGNYYITDVFLLEQEVSGATTDIESDAIAHLALQLEEQGIDSSTLRFWGHSHVNMGVTPSGQDESQTQEYIEDCHYFIRGIYNKKRDMKVDVFDVDKGLVFQRCDNKVFDPEYSTEFTEQIQAEVTEKVKQKTYYNNYGGNAGGSYRPNYGRPYNAGIYNQQRAQAHQHNKAKEDQKLLNYYAGAYEEWNM